MTARRGRGARRARRRDRDVAALHRGVRPGDAAAREHGNRNVLRRRIAGDADVEPVRADISDRHHADPQGEIEVLLHPGRGFGERLPRCCCGLGRHREAGAVAAEHEREIAICERIGDGDNHRGAGHVDGLVAILGDGLGRLHHVGDADHPVARQRRKQPRVHHAGEVAQNRQALVEAVGRHGGTHGRDIIPQGCLSPELHPAAAIRRAVGDAGFFQIQFVFDAPACVVGDLTVA
jgi:hypothetical protein